MSFPDPVFPLQIPDTAGTALGMSSVTVFSHNNKARSQVEHADQRKEAEALM